MFCAKSSARATSASVSVARPDIPPRLDGRPQRCGLLFLLPLGYLILVERDGIAAQVDRRREFALGNPSVDRHARDAECAGDFRHADHRAHRGGFGGHLVVSLTYDQTTSVFDTEV